jgi:hypothetical protein
MHYKAVILKVFDELKNNQNGPYIKTFGLFIFEKFPEESKEAIWNKLNEGQSLRSFLIPDSYKKELVEKLNLQHAEKASSYLDNSP